MHKIECRQGSGISMHNLILKICYLFSRLEGVNLLKAFIYIHSRLTGIIRIVGVKLYFAVCLSRYMCVLW